MSRSIMMLMVVVAIFLAIAVTSTVAGSCKEASLCCTGRDSSCVVQKTPINAIVEDLSDKPCYCDHACLKLGDCCPDFKDACGVSDCKVSAWGPWSPCDAACGPGTMTRERSVERAPQHGGRHCPSLLQKRGCQGASDCQQHDRSAIRETALLLPGALSHSRRVNETSDIRRNLRLRYENDVQHDRALEYCVEFEVIKASKACHKEAAYSGLQEGERVLVRCEAEALHRSLGVRCEGHGSPGRTTRFAALASPSCRGKWLRLTPASAANTGSGHHHQRDNNSCQRTQENGETDAGAQFIFV